MSLSNRSVGVVKSRCKDGALLEKRGPCIPNSHGLKRAINPHKRNSSVVGSKRNFHMSDTIHRSIAVAGLSAYDLQLTHYRYTA